MTNADRKSPADSRAGWFSFSAYARKRFGTRVRKIPVDAGFTCPNRDGTRGAGGCTFCNNEAFSPSVLGRTGSRTPVPVRDQVEEWIRKARRPGKFMVYFQAFSNTYAPVGKLKEIYDEALFHPDIVALAVGTRPDCIDLPRARLLASYAEKYEVWVELGLQTIHEETLRRINRGHTAEEFFSSVELLSGFPLKICVHVILGLPGETREHHRLTARALARLPYHGLKIHPLQILEGTRLADEFRRGEAKPPTEEEFVLSAADFLELTPPTVVVQRLSADALGSTLVAPEWCRNKQRVIRLIEKELGRRGTRQGAVLEGS